MSNKLQESTEAPGDATTVAEDEELIRSRRDAAATQQALVRAARRRFATEGYRATTVRHIAADVGVNVALISRYFGSKEGLFEACMNRSVDELEPAATPGPVNLDEVIARILAHIVESPNPDDPLQLLLLLRSSGDENADRIRRRTLEKFTENLAAAVGWHGDDPDSEPLLLRAQIAIATMLGLVMLRTATDVQPLASASSGQLTEPVEQALRALLDPQEKPHG